MSPYSRNEPHDHHPLYTSKRRLIKGTRAFYFHNRLTWLIAGMMLLLAICSLGYSMLERTENYSLLFLFMGMLVLTLVFMFLVIPINAGKTMMADERTSSPVIIDADEETLCIRTSDVETRLDWSSFGRLVETGEYFLLIQVANPNCFQIIPKCGFISRGDETEFRSLAEERIGYFAARRRNRAVVVHPGR